LKFVLSKDLANHLAANSSAFKPANGDPDISQKGSSSTDLDRGVISKDDDDDEDEQKAVSGIITVIDGGVFNQSGYSGTYRVTLDLLLIFRTTKEEKKTV